MKLSVKIFLGICIPSIIAILIISAVLINNSFKSNIENETNRCVQEFRIMEFNINNAFENSTADDKTVIEAYSEYYANKGINFIYYEDNQKVFESPNYTNLNNGNFNVDNTKILNPEYDNVLSKIEKIGKEHYIFISTRLENNQILIYNRSVNKIYQIRDNLIKLCVVLVGLIIIIIFIIAYRISKSLTKPLVKMQHEMIRVSKGDYNIHLKEGKNEIGLLASNFNKMSKELDTRNNELVDMINSKQLFIDNLSHEINTPLTSILGYSELLEKANCSEDQRIKFLVNIQEEAKRINDIHKKLLLLSYKKNADLEKKDVDANKIFEEVQRLVEFKLQKHNMNLIINNSLDKIYGDETLISMCITNLVSNAITASKDGSKIIINSFEQVGKSCIHVIDEGQGISKENIEKIVEPFYRVDKARSRKNGGAGLGLSICKSIMELHNGTLKIESELGKGSCFILEFPKM